MEIIKTTLFARCAISAIIALSLSLVSGCATSKIIKNSKGAAGLQQKIRKSPIHWEFTLTSKHGEIKKNKNNQPLLVLNDKHMNKVIMFSKEPFHFVKKITPKQFKAFWQAGPNTFKDTPPSAIVLIKNQPQAVQLTSVSINKNSMSFALEPHSKNQTIKSINGPVILTIDAGKHHIMYALLSWLK